MDAMTRQSSKLILPLGWVILFLAVAGTIREFIMQSGYSPEVNVIWYVGNSFLGVLGGLAIVIGSALKKIETRLSTVEGKIRP